MSSLPKLRRALAFSSSDVKNHEWFKEMSKDRQDEYLKLHQAHEDSGSADHTSRDLSEFHADEAKEARHNKDDAGFNFHSSMSNHYYRDPEEEQQATTKPNV